MYDYFYNYRVLPEMHMFCMNLDLFNSLPAEDQAIIGQAATTAARDYWSDNPVAEEEWHQAGIDAGLEIVELTAEEKAINVAKVREEVWPQMKSILGSVIMQQIRDFAQPVPGS